MRPHRRPDEECDEVHDRALRGVGVHQVLGGEADRHHTNPERRAAAECGEPRLHVAPIVHLFHDRVEQGEGHANEDRPPHREVELRVRLPHPPREHFLERGPERRAASGERQSHGDKHDGHDERDVQYDQPQQAKPDVAAHPRPVEAD